MSSFANVVATDTESSMSPEHVVQGSTPQRLSLTSAVAPILSKVTAPFDRTERKRAHTSAVYYSECFLRGIQPLDADSAAKEAQDQYDKWWINRTARCEKREMTDNLPGLATPSGMLSGTDCYSGTKRRRHGTEEESSLKSSNTVSVASVGESSSADGRIRGVGNGDKEARNNFGDIRQISILSISRRKEVALAKSRLIEDLKASGGDVESPCFTECMNVLEAFYKSKSWDGRGSCSLTPFSLEGNWLTLSKPTYDECKGRNQEGNLLYTLGRMSFGMFRPTNLVCSVQASFNTVRTIDAKNPGRPLHVPKKLMHDIQSGDIHLRTYDIVVAITIQPGQDRLGVLKEGDNDGYTVPKPIRGILTNQGYALPDPKIPNRLSIWFSGGSLEVQDEPADLDEWKRVFDSACAPERNLREYADILAARVLLGALLSAGMEDDGSMSFTLKKPIGGHGCAYCDIIYMDENLRIMRGHLGSVYVCSRVPEPQHIYV